MFVRSSSVLAALSVAHCAEHAFQWTPPVDPQTAGEDYVIKHVDLDQQVIVTDDDRRVTPAGIVNAAFPGFLGSEDGPKWASFNQEWFASMVSSFDSRATGPEDIQEFLSTDKSHNLTLKMNLFEGPRNWNFGTHVHKNLEYMKVLAGTLHEYRSDGLVTQIQPQDKNVSLPADGAFHVETTGAGMFEINEFGSLHTSYTLDDGMLLLTVYTGDWFYGVDGCQNPDFVCTPNGCGKSPAVGTYEEICNMDWSKQYIEV